MSALLFYSGKYSLKMEILGCKDLGGEDGLGARGVRFSEPLKFRHLFFNLTSTSQRRGIFMLGVCISYNACM